MPLGSVIAGSLTDRSRQRTLQTLGVFCGVAAALWLAAAEAPTKLVTIAVSPLIISFMMVLGAFISRWSLPALIRGTSDIGRDVRQAPHLVVWGILAGCLWAVGNTLTIFGVRDIGLSIAFPLWNSNSLIGIAWGILFFRELRRAGWLRWVGVVGGAVIIFGGALVLSFASTSQNASPHPLRGVAAALGAGLMFGTMYIPYRKAYISGMNPLSFITFFTFGEMGTITVLTLVFLGGVAPVWHELVRSRGVLFWPLLGGFMWVIGDLFQNFAAKYVGISRGIPLSNTNQLWGLLWGILVFGELRGAPHGTLAKVVGGSLLMAVGAVAIAFSSAPEGEYVSWKEAAQRESDLYSIDPAYVAKSMEGREKSETPFRRTWLDWSLVVAATSIFVAFGAMAVIPHLEINWIWLAGLTSAMLVVLVICGLRLRRITGFS
jgi:drug/metabolite transporter (DMT)-like permease